MNRRLINLRGWDGPDQDAYRNPCAECDGEGFHEDGEQIDVDDFIPALCCECAGTGIAAMEEAA